MLPTDNESALPSVGSGFQNNKDTFELIFRGWLPNISGRLSFRAFGKTLYPTRAYSANVSDGETSFLVTYQHRNTSDIALPFRSMIGPKLFSLDGNLVFVCIAKTTHGANRTQEFMEGWLYIIEDLDDWRKEARQLILKQQDDLHSYEDGIMLQTLSDMAGVHIARLIEDIKKYSIFNSQFSLSRSGSVSVGIPRDMVLNAQAPEIPERETGKMMQMLAAQMFFFLRDLGHRHQHHDRRTDTICDLHKILGNDDVSWRNQTLYSMYRKVIDLRRQQKSDAFANALGVIAYAQSFFRVCEEELSKENVDKLPRYHFEEAKDSINAKKSAIDANAERRERVREGRTSILLGMSAVVIAFIALIQITDWKVKADPDITIQIIGHYSVVHPLRVLVSFSAVYALCAWGLTISDPLSLSFFRKGLRVFHAIDRWLNITILFALAIFSIFFMYLIVTVAS